MAGNFQPTEPTIRMLFAPEHFKDNGELQLNAFYDKGNDVSLCQSKDIEGESVKDYIHSLATKIEVRKKRNYPAYEFIGICLLCSQEILKLEHELYSLHICATPNLRLWNEERNRLGGTKLKKYSDNKFHASLWILKEGKIFNLPALPEPGETVDPNFMPLFDMIRILIKGISEESLGKLYTLNEFKENSLEEISGFCFQI